MARNEEQNQKMRDDRQERILSTAVKLFARRGLAATKIADIAKASGMSQGLMYHYFDSKEEIFTEIIRIAFKRMNTAARELEALELTPRAKLEMVADHIASSLASNDDFAWFSALIAAASISDAIPPKAKTIIRRERGIPYQVVERIVRQGQKRGDVRKVNARELALLFWTAVKGLSMHKVALGKDFQAPSSKVLKNIFFDEVMK